MYNVKSKSTPCFWAKAPKEQLYLVLTHTVEKYIRDIAKWFYDQTDLQSMPVGLKQILFDANLIIHYLERNIQAETTSSDMARAVGEIINSRMSSEEFSRTPTTENFCGKIIKEIGPYLNYAENGSDTYALAGNAHK